jgi:NDP-sugar pyrophosphorylase family protein
LSASDAKLIENAGILAAGEGSRLRSLKVPKPLVPVCGIPLIEWTVRGLIQAGAKRIACVVNENLREVEKFLLGRDFGVKVQVRVKTTESSLISLLALREFLEGSPFLLSTTDTILPLREWRGFGAAASKIGAPGQAGGLDALLGVTGFVEDENPLWVHVDEQGIARAIGLEAQGPLGGVGIRLVTSGLYAFHPSVYADAEMVSRAPGARLRNFLSQLPKTGRRVGTHRFRKTVDVDRPEDLRAAELFLKEAGLP